MKALPLVIGLITCLCCAPALAGDFKSISNENTALYEEMLKKTASLRAYDAELNRSWQNFYALFDPKAQITVRRWSVALWAISLKKAAQAAGSDPAKYYQWQHRHNPFLQYMKKVLELAREPDGLLPFALYPIWQLHESPWQGWMTPYEDAKEVVFILRFAEEGLKTPPPGREERALEWQLLPGGDFYYSTLRHDAFDFIYSMRPDASGALCGSVYEKLRDDTIEGFIRLLGGRIGFAGDP